MTTDAADIAREATRTGAVSAGLISIGKGESMRQFRDRALLSGAVVNPNLGMSRSEIARYSIGRALQFARGSTHDQTSPSGSFEAEIHAELVKRFGDPIETKLTVMLPLDVLAHHARRDLATNGSAGFLVGTSVNGVIELARPASVILRMGAELLEGLRENVTIVTEKTRPTVQAHPTQTTATTESTASFGQIAMTPKDLSAYTEVSRDFLHQTGESSQQFIVRQLLTAVGIKIDQLALQGTGTQGEFLGIRNVPGIGSVAGTSLALAGVLEMQTDTGDRLGSTGGYVTTRAVAALLAAREKFAGNGDALWRGNLYEGELGGFRAMTTSNIASGEMIFGNWAHFLVASWGTLAVQINPFAGFREGIVGLRATHWCDTAVRDPLAFSASTSIT